MKRCDACNVEILAPRVHCPLCEAPLVDDGSGGDAREVYPVVPTTYKKYNLFFRILIFLSIAAVAVCLITNLAFQTGGWWSLIVLAGVAYMWVTIIYGIRRVHRISRSILYQMLATSAVALLIDHLYGSYGWALDYVVPALCLFAMIAIAVIALVSRIGAEEFVIYIVVNALLGIVPLAFVLIGLTDVRWPSMTCAILSVLCLIGVFIFGGEDVRQEFRKRFHV